MGTYGTYPNAGMDESVAQATEALATAMTVAAERQAAAVAFIRDNGPTVVGGHPALVEGQDQRGIDARPPA